MAKRVACFDEAILHHAKQEFLENGYENASLRTIAGNASVSTSTIYTRFRDKEGLFQALIGPAADQLVDYLQTSFLAFESLDAAAQQEQEEACACRGYQGLLDILYGHFDEFKLLVTSSTNGIYRRYLEKIVELDVQCTVEFLKASRNAAYLEGQLTPGLIHILSAGFYSGIFELAVHNIRREESEPYFEELKRFYRQGWSLYL